MTEPREKLSATQVRDASLADWRQILGRIKARFRTGDFRTGLALVNKIGAAAEAANHHPDIQLPYTEEAAKQGDLHVQQGHDLMEYFLFGNMAK